MGTKAKAHDFEGNTVEGAIERAIETLGVSRENMNIKILSEGRRGLFGMEGAYPARIKVALKQKKD